MKNIPFIWKKENPIKTNIYQHRQIHSHIYRHSYMKHGKHEKIRATLTPLHRNTNAFECTFRNIRTLSNTHTQRSRHSHWVLQFRTRFRLLHSHKRRQSMNRLTTFRISAFLLKETTYHSKPYKRRMCEKKPNIFIKQIFPPKKETKPRQTPETLTQYKSRSHTFWTVPIKNWEKGKNWFINTFTNTQHTHTWKQIWLKSKLQNRKSQF